MTWHYREFCQGKPKWNTKYEIQNLENDLSKVKITCQNKCDKNLWKDALAYAIIVIKCKAKSPQQHHPFDVWNNSTLEWDSIDAMVWLFQWQDKNKRKKKGMNWSVQAFDHFTIPTISHILATRYQMKGPNSLDDKVNIGVEL